MSHSGRPEVPADQAPGDGAGAGLSDLQKTAYELTEHLPVGTYTMVLLPGEKLARFAFMSRRFLEMAGMTAEEARADPMRVFALVHPDDRDEWIALNARVFERREPFKGETRVIIDGRTRWYRAESVPRGLEDGSTVWEGVLIDITEQKEAEQALVKANRELERLANFDHLTGLANRRHYEDLAVREMVRVLRYGGKVSQILLDIDHFKRVNDRFGHAAGDRFLVECSRLLEERLREADLLARLGGEEFVILLPESDLDEAMQLAEQLRIAIAGFSFTLVGPVTASFGAAEWIAGESFSKWLNRADHAMYRAKRAGRNRVEKDQ